MKNTSQVKYLVVSNDESGQRIDNFLMRHLKGVPKSRLYRLLRKGEVRVNSKRISACYRLNEADRLRLPPVYLAERAVLAPPSAQTLRLLKDRILYEDENVLVLNKPCGMSVHGGSTVRMGVIEALRCLYKEYPNIELAHRLDSDTSGCLLLAKNKRTLRELHALLREGKVKKIYWALTRGVWRKEECTVSQPLHKQYGEAGKHRVIVHESGKTACTLFHPLRVFDKQASLMEVTLLTGRTHQIRVHAAFVKHPIAGDDRYGDAQFTQSLKAFGLKRLFLHAKQIDFVLPSTGQHITVTAPLDESLDEVLQKL